jgi:signal peptidase I
MRRLLCLLAVAAVAGVGGCQGAKSEVEQYTQGGVSMEPTVKAGQVINARAVGSKYRPKRGDVILFRPGGGKWPQSTAPFLKRVIAVGGETVACCDPAGKVTVNGTPLAEPYVANDSPLDAPPNPQYCGSRQFGPVAVPAGSLFVMGDNRAASNDSRCQGPIPVTSVSAVMVR